MEAKIKIDASDLERRLDRIRRDQERTGSTFGSKLVIAAPFIAALEASGLVPKGTTYVRITAEIAGPLRLDYETIASSELVAVAESLRAASGHDEATVR